MTDHQVILVIASALLAGITSGRAAWKLGEIWGMSLLNARRERDLCARDVMTFFSAVAAMVLAGFACNAAIEHGGDLFGLGAVFFTMPAVGAVWVFGLGANKAVERLLSGIEVKLSK